MYEFASLKEIKNKYRELLKEWHPDLCRGNEVIRKQKTIEIINAHRSPEELWSKQFWKDPICGNYQDDEPEQRI